MKFILILSIICVFSLFAVTLSTKRGVTCKNPLLNNLLKQMRKEKSIHFRKVQSVLCKVDRNNFLLKKQKTKFDIESLYIGHGATLSRPDAQVFGLEKAFQKFKSTKKALKILDIGSGSGIM